MMFILLECNLITFGHLEKNVYTKITGGILENMYGGIGVEALYKPF